VGRTARGAYWAWLRRDSHLLMGVDQLTPQ
jgi:hypothetical protein